MKNSAMIATGKRFFPLCTKYLTHRTKLSPDSVLIKRVLIHMLFLWSREPAPAPRAGPWFAWFATALVLWRCRRSVVKAILAASPLRLLKRRNLLPQTSSKASSTATLTKQRLRPENSMLQRKHRHTGIRTKVKRLCTGDGPHVTSSTFTIQSQQIHYKVTRSGKIYGKYPNKVATPMTNGQGNH
ncbi:unnamed protein product [Heterotrigona itama]|uniref:Uncharacterized protein n=1 Tax=Heterotrigona itama TaxID=395501 RepID=A0A6V7HBN4_9HYME|nr:unnamed protein product [Heterotrigona itama]